MSLTVSILINNYNYGRFLREAIDSALAQTYPHCEVVVVDDGSTDESAEVIRSYGAKIRAVFKKNGGQASAFNAGFAEATGDIIMFLDSDDYLHPVAAERIVGAWKSESEILHHRLRVVDLSGKEIGHIPSQMDAMDSGDVTPLLLRYGRFSHPTTSGLAYSRRFLHKLLPMPEQEYRISADIWLFCKGPFLAPVTVLDETLASYRVHTANAVGAALPGRLTSLRKLQAFIKGLDVRFDLLKQQAAQRGTPITDTFDWETSITLRSRLILARLGLPHGGSSSKASLARDMLKKVASEPYTLAGRAQQSLLAFLIWLAPQTLLRRLFPNIFDVKPEQRAVSLHV